MSESWSRYLVMVRRGPDEPVPKHPAMHDVRPGPDELYRFWFITRRPKVPAPHIPGHYRYVEDFEEAFGDVTVRPLDAIHDQSLQEILEATEYA